MKYGISFEIAEFLIVEFIIKVIHVIKYKVNLRVGAPHLSKISI